jgi:BASS family bile acid:Na+ symporter
MDIVQLSSVTARICILVFVVSSMLSMGVSLTVAQIVTPLRDTRRVVLALVANFVLVPLLTYAVVLLIPVSEGQRIALILMATAAGAPFLPKLAEVAKGDIAFSVGLMLLLMVGTIVYLPLVLPWLLQGVAVNPWKIAGSLILLMMVPLAAGLVLRARTTALADRLGAVLAKISNLALLLLTTLLVVLNFKNILSMIGPGGLAVILFLFVSLGAGFFLGGRTAAARSVMALGTGQRNISAALVVAGQNFKDPEVMVTLIVTAVVGLLILMPAAALMKKGN